MEGFLGGNTSDLKIGDLSAPIMTRKIIGESTSNALEILPTILGQWFCKVGVFKRHRELNSILPLYLKWGSDYVNKRIEQEKKKM